MGLESASIEDEVEKSGTIRKVEKFKLCLFSIRNSVKANPNVELSDSAEFPHLYTRGIGSFLSLKRCISISETLS